MATVAKTPTKKANQNYSTSLAGGGSVTVKNGVKTYSDKPLQVKGNNGISISGKSYSKDKGGSGFAPKVNATDIGITKATLPNQVVPVNKVNDLAFNSATALGDGLTMDKGMISPYQAQEGDSAGVTAAKESANTIGAYLQNYLPQTQPADNASENALQAAIKQSGQKKAQQEVNRYSGQINAITSARDAQTLALEQQGRGQTGSFIGGEQARISREAAIQALPVQAQLAAAQGNLEAATTLMGQLYQAKSADIQAQQTYKTNYVNSILQYANQAESNILQAKLADIKKRDDAELADLNYLRQNVSNAIQSGATTQEIGQLGSDLLTTQEKVSLAQTIQARQAQSDIALDNEAKRASINASNTSRLLDLYNAGDLNAAKALGITLPDNSVPSTDELAYAQQYAATGNIPSGMPKNISFGTISALAKDLPKPNGTLVNANSGVADTRVGAAESEDIKRLYNITQGIQRLKELDKKRIGGLTAGTLGKIFGSQAQSAYLAQRKTIVDDIARMQTGAALTEDEQDFYNDYLPGRFSEPLIFGQDSLKKIEEFETVMNNKLKNSLVNNQLTIYGYSEVDLGDEKYKVGEIITNASGQKGIVQPDGTITPIN